MAMLANLLADMMTPALPQRAIVVYRSGADGNIGTSYAARAEPDGRTVLLTGSSFLMNPLLNPDAAYDPMRDFDPVARLAVAPNVLIANAALRGKTLEQLLAKPAGSLAFATAGHGNSSHIAAELFMAKTGARWLHVPYRGTGPAVRAVEGGEVQLMFVPAGVVPGAVATGKVFALGVAAPSRVAALPDVPTFAELGVRGADNAQWYGVFVPAGTPPAVSRQLSELVVRTVQDPAMRKRLEATGMDPAALAQREFADFLAAERERMAALVKTRGIRKE